jgi:hypothetical protein
MCYRGYLPDIFEYPFILFRWVRVMVFYATFNNISVISWHLENQRKPSTYQKSLTNVAIRLHSESLKSLSHKGV